MTIDKIPAYKSNVLLSF